MIQNGKGPIISPMNLPLTEEKAAKTAILRARARILAAESVGQKASEDTVEIVIFSMMEERYAIESSYIREIYPVREITPLPGTPSFVLGIANIRGQILSVLDLRRLFELPAFDSEGNDRVIVIGSPESGAGEMIFGVMVDSIIGAQTLNVSAIQPLPSASGGGRSEYVAGVTTDGLIVLNADNLLTDDRIVVHEEVK